MRTMWILWCIAWTAFWFAAAIFQAGFNPICDMLFLASPFCIAIPVGVHRCSNESR